MVPLSHPVTPSSLQFITAPCPPAALGFLGAGAASLCDRLSLKRVQLGSLHLPVSIRSHFLSVTFFCLSREYQQSPKLRLDIVPSSFWALSHTAAISP